MDRQEIHVDGGDGPWRATDMCRLTEFVFERLREAPDVDLKEQHGKTCMGVRATSGDCGVAVEVSEEYGHMISVWDEQLLATQTRDDSVLLLSTVIMRWGDSLPTFLREVWHVLDSNSLP